jgi:hypothetical protein
VLCASAGPATATKAARIKLCTSFIHPPVVGTASLL